MSVQNLTTIKPISTKSVGVEQETSEAKKPEIKENGKTLIIAGLTALGLAGVATVAIVKGKKAKVKNIPVAISQLPPKSEAAIKNGIEQIAEGKKSYEKIKKQATRNQTHVDKKHIQQELRQVRDAKLAQEFQTIQVSKEQVKIQQEAGAQLQKAKQGMKNADVESLETRVENAKIAVNNAQEAAKVQRNIANANPTENNKMQAVRAEHKAATIKAEAQKVEARAQERMGEIGEEIGKKRENRAKMISSPGYEAGQAKQAQNAQKTQGNKAKTKIAQLRKQPAYMDMMRKLKSGNASIEKLQKELNAGKLKNAEALAVKDWLDTIKVESHQA